MQVSATNASANDPPGLLCTSASPGSIVAIAERNRVAWPCRVAELRFRGTHLPAELLLSRPYYAGHIVTVSSAPQEWESTLYASLDEERTHINPLSEIRTIRLNHDGMYLLGGTAWDAGYFQRWPQDWLCGPTDEVVTNALRTISGWLRKRYTGVYGRIAQRIPASSTLRSQL